MPERPFRIDRATRVSRVRACRRVSAAQRVSQGQVDNFAGESAVALSAEFSIPVIFGQPHFDVDGRIRARRGHHFHSAKRGEFLSQVFAAVLTARRIGWRDELSRGYLLRRDDFRARQCELLQAFAGPLSICGRGKSCDPQQHQHDRSLHPDHRILPASRGHRSVRGIIYLFAARRAQNAARCIQQGRCQNRQIAAAHLIRGERRRGPSIFVRASVPFPSTRTS